VITVDDQVVVGFDRRRLEELLAQKAQDRPRLGAAVADAEPRLQVDGAYIGRVKANSPAAGAGLRSGDVIVELNRQPVHTAADVERVVGGLQRGDRVRLMYLRHGQVMQGELTL